MHRSLERLIDALVRLPGVGRKSAQRISFHLLKQPDCASELGTAIAEAHSALHTCPECFGLAEDGLCEICSDRTRDRTLLCVVEEPSDVLAFEQAALFRGVYHVLGGVLSPIEGVGPGDLHLAELARRAADGEAREVVVATNPTTEGEATAVYIARALKGSGVKVTRIARGLPVGADIELADVETIIRSLEGRREL
ncbi:MAG: recombination mediator RecR [bacterium]|jgi:recombination protein RecR